MSSRHCGTMSPIKASDLWSLGNWSAQRKERGGCSNGSICYPLPLAPSLHSRPGIQDILKWRRLLLGVCLKPSDDWLEAEGPGREPSTPEFTGANQPAEPEPLIPADRQFSLSDAAGFGAQNRRPPASSWAQFLGPEIHVFLNFSNQSIFSGRIVQAGLTFVEQRMRSQLSSHICELSSHVLWTSPEKPHRPPVPCGEPGQTDSSGPTQKHHSGLLSEWLQRVTAHAAAGDFQRQLLLPEVFALKTSKSSGTALTEGKSPQLMTASATQMWTISLNAVGHSHQKHHQTGMARPRVAEKFHCRDIEIMTPFQLWKEMRWLWVKMPWWIG